jgi:GTP cyclohydrolase II
MKSGGPEHASCNFESHYGRAQLHVYAFGDHEEDNILCIDARKPGDQDATLVRVQSACYTAEIFRSTDCDCHEQLDESLKLIHSQGGLLVYMICDGRGAGLLTKVRGLALGDTADLDTFDAYERLGVAPDPRNYDRVAEVLRSLGVTNMRLLTNNPRKTDGLASAGIGVTRVPLEIAPTEGSRRYLRTKQLKFGHLLNIKDD